MIMMIREIVTGYLDSKMIRPGWYRQSKSLTSTEEVYSKSINLLSESNILYTRGDIIITALLRKSSEFVKMLHVPFTAIDEEMSSLREIAGITSLIEARAIAVMMKKKKAQEAGFIMIWIPIGDCDRFRVSGGFR